MSVLSDDTDVLLLIPPDFFSVPSDSDEDSVNLNKPNEKLLVSDLISQVNDLEGRICMIENQSGFNSMSVQGNLQRLRHFGSADTLNTSQKSNCNSRSLQTTPMKTHTLPASCKNWRDGFNKSPLKYHNRNEHQNMLMSHHYVNQRERDDQLLREIHSFFKQKSNKSNGSSDVIETYTEGIKLVSGVTDSENIELPTTVFNLNKVNDLLKQLEETQAQIEQKLKLKGFGGINDEDSLLLDSPDKKKFNLKFSEVLSNESTTHNKSPKRYLNFNDLSPKKTEKIVTNEKEEKVRTDVPSTGEVELDVDSNESKEEIVSSRQNTEFQSSSELSNLLSLNNLWGSNKKINCENFEDLKVLKQKYLEEKCRRQHCEELIQKLQLRLLEEQQKIAVAMKVDMEKDEAISKLTEGWHKLLGHWKELEEQRNNLSKKLQTEREKFQNEVSVACQTVKRYEDELSKALDLAHGYKEKCELSERERKNFTANANKEIEMLKAELQDVSDKLQKEQNQSEKLEKLVMAKDESLTQAKSKIFDTQSQIRELKKNLKDQQTELEILKHDKEKLGEKLKEEKSKVGTLEQCKKNLLQSNEEFKKKEKTLKENIKSMTEQMEKIKLDLKEFYQEQVEKIVQEKLKEFQEQLSKAEKTLQKELEDRERKVTELAVKQVQQIVEKHVVEVNLIEEKHKEEIELWRIKVIQAEERVKELQKRLENYSSHKTEIAQKLQNIMETQWQETLKIITASSPQQQKSPINSGRLDGDKCLSRQNTFTMLSTGWGDGELNKNGVPPDVESTSGSTNTETPFCKEGQLTHREQIKIKSNLNYRINETPQKIDAEVNDPLKKYIQMLLERPPGLPADDSIDKSFDSCLLNNLVDGSSVIPWQHILSERSSQAISDLGKQDDIC